jgi:hypothetical protein
VVIVVAVLILVGLAMALKIVKQYEQGVPFRLGRVRGLRNPGLRKAVGQHSLDETMSETDRINLDIRRILDGTTAGWSVEVTLVEMKDIQLPDSVKRAMARRAEAEREKKGEDHQRRRGGDGRRRAGRGVRHDDGAPVAVQLRNLQSLVEIGVDKNTTVVFPAPLMSTIEELGAFLTREKTVADNSLRPASQGPAPAEVPASGKGTQAA